MWYLIVSFISLTYLVIYLILPDLFSGFIGIYVVRPLLLIVLAIVVVLTARKQDIIIWDIKRLRRWGIGNNPFQAGFLVGGFQITLLIFMGLVNGFAKSPYQFTLRGIAFNLLFVTSSLFAIELGRSYLIQNGVLKRKNTGYTIISVTLFFFLIQLFPKLLNITIINTPVEAVQFIGTNVLPLLAMGLFASYLVFYGGAIAGIGYMGVIQFFEWFSPILPNIEWMPMALISTIGPAVGFFIIQSSIKTPRHQVHPRPLRRQIKDPSVRWIGVAVISIFLIFFSYGYLGVQPTVIYSGSMQPSLDVGDIVLIRDTDSRSIQEGDIIQYREDDKMIIHRVHEIVHTEDELFFITKGDANRNPDTEPVYPGQIQGKAIFNIPKLGWVSIYMRNIF